MSVDSHISEFAGKPVVNWEPGMELSDAGSHAYRIGLDWDEYDAGNSWVDKFDEFVKTAGIEGVTAFIVGPWGGVAEGDSAELIVERLVTGSENLPNLTAIFLGDIVSEESEISWIQQTDLSPLLLAYPNLTTLQVRGASNLRLGHPKLDRLHTLVIQSGGLSSDVVRDVLSANLPALKHLELWLGTDYYGADTTVDDLSPLLEGGLFPNLKYLGLRDSEIADGIASAIADAPILDRIDVLDLSLGTLSDTGAQALLNSGRIHSLKKLDLHHHYCTDAIVSQLKQLPLEVDVSEQETGDEEDRYVAVSE